MSQFPHFLYQEFNNMVNHFKDDSNWSVHVVISPGRTKPSVYIFYLWEVKVGLGNRNGDFSLCTIYFIINFYICLIICV